MPGLRASMATAPGLPRSLGLRSEKEQTTTSPILMGTCRELGPSPVPAGAALGVCFGQRGPILKRTQGFPGGERHLSITLRDPTHPVR